MGACLKRGEAEDTIAEPDDVVPGPKIPEEGRRRERQTMEAAMVENGGDDGGGQAPVVKGGIRPIDSSALFAKKDQCIIIFDWDDTLFPTHWFRSMRKYCNAPSDLQMKIVSMPDYDAVRCCGAYAMLLLQKAMTLGEVVLVTNSQRPWVTNSCSLVFPGLMELLGKIECVYASEFAHALPSFPPKGKAKPGASASVQRFTDLKRLAMQHVISKFYSRYQDQSWKNIVSIGDGIFEYEAVHQVVRAKRRGRLDKGSNAKKKRVRLKTIKMLPSPSVDALVNEIADIYMCLDMLVNMDEDVDIEIETQSDRLGRIGRKSQNRMSQHDIAMEVKKQLKQKPSVAALPQLISEYDQTRPEEAKEHDAEQDRKTTAASSPNAGPTLKTYTSGMLNGSAIAAALCDDDAPAAPRPDAIQEEDEAGPPKAAGKPGAVAPQPAAAPATAWDDCPGPGGIPVDAK